MKSLEKSLIKQSHVETITSKFYQKMEQFLAQLISASQCSVTSLEIFLDRSMSVLSPVQALTIPQTA